MDGPAETATARREYSPASRSVKRGPRESFPEVQRGPEDTLEFVLRKTRVKVAPVLRIFPNDIAAPGGVGFGGGDDRFRDALRIPGGPSDEREGGERLGGPTIRRVLRGPAREARAESCREVPGL